MFFNFKIMQPSIPRNIEYLGTIIVYMEKGGGVDVKRTKD